MLIKENKSWERKNPTLWRYLLLTRRCLSFQTFPVPGLPCSCTRTHIVLARLSTSLYAYWPFELFISLVFVHEICIFSLQVQFFIQIHMVNLAYQGYQTFCFKILALFPLQFNFFFSHLFVFRTLILMESNVPILCFQFLPLA